MRVPDPKQQNVAGTAPNFSTCTWSTNGNNAHVQTVIFSCVQFLAQFISNDCHLALTNLGDNCVVCVCERDETEKGMWGYSDSVREITMDPFLLSSPFSFFWRSTP